MESTSRLATRAASSYRHPISLLVPIVAALLVAGCQQEVPEKNMVRPVKAIKVADPSGFADRVFPGKAKATQELELSFRVAGPLIMRPVNVGDAVKEGDIVARIDPRDYEVNLRAVKGQLADARAVLTRARADYKRSSNIYKEDPGAISETAVDRALQDRDRAAATVQSLQASVESAEDALGYTNLKTPFHGIIVATYVENFEDVRAKQPIMRILDDSRIEMIINIPESLISLTPDVKDITVTFDVFPGRPVPATIKELGTEASETTRTYPVTLIMDQPEDFKVLPGMAGKAHGTPPASFTGDSLEVPVAAVFTSDDDDKSYVWTIDESSETVARREVTVGELTDRGIRIDSGLESGEWIATAGVHYLAEGQKVKLLRD